MDPKQRGVNPQDRQTGLPPEIYYQPERIGGSLGFGVKSDLEDFWDQLEVEAAADAAAPGAGVGGDGDLRQILNNFLFQATTVSQLVVPYNISRVYLFMQNLGAADTFAAFGQEATINQGVRMSAGGGFYEPILGTVSSVHIIAAAGIQNVQIVEGFRVG